MLAPNLIPYKLVLPLAISILTLFTTGCANTAKQVQSSPIPQSSEQLAPPPTPAVQSEPEKAPAPTVAIQPKAPKSHVVVKGDTLWDISTKFLKKPWYWPEIWQVNPQIENPHLIYPGDVLTLYYIDGKPFIKISGGPRVPATERHGPKIRVEQLQSEDTGLPIGAIHQFMVRPKIVTKEELEKAPHIVGSQDNRLIYGMHDLVYVRNLDNVSAAHHYSVYRPGKPIRDPSTGELLGYEAILVGDAKVIKSGRPTTVQLMHMEREALVGDRLLPLDNKDQDRTFHPHSPEYPIEGTVVSLFDAISQIGQYQVAVVNLGERNDIEKGHVLAIYETGRIVQDPFSMDRANNKLALPDERSGVMLVFRVFDKLSYGLIMDAHRPIRVGNTVRQP